MSDSSKVQDGAGKRLPPNAGKGRKPGVPNKSTIEFRETITQLLSDNSANVAIWLEQVATGGMNPDKADPGKALDLMAKLAEYAAPKLNRTEVTGKDGGPVEITRVELVPMKK